MTDPKPVELTDAERDAAIADLAMLMGRAFKYATPGQESKFGGTWGAVAAAVIAAGWVSPEEHRAEVERLAAFERHAAELAVSRLERAEKAESTLAGLRRVQAETVERYQKAEAKVARVEAVRSKWDERGAGTLNDWQWCKQMLDDLTAALAEPEREEESGQ